MIRRCGILIIFVSLLFSVNIIPGASARTPDEDAYSYEQLSPNGKYVFVMLAKGKGNGARVDTLKGRYPHSGLYRTGGPRKALWTVNWYASQVHVSSDGIHLVRVGRPVVLSINKRPDMTQLALAFYEKGKPSAKYMVADLIQDPGKLAKSASGFLWQERIAFDDASGRLEVTTVEGQKMLFNIKTGKALPIKSGANKK